jgi:hypothetical protein
MLFISSMATLFSAKGASPKIGHAPPKLSRMKPL